MTEFFSEFRFEIFVFEINHRFQYSVTVPYAKCRFKRFFSQIYDINDGIQLSTVIGEFIWEMPDKYKALEKKMRKNIERVMWAVQKVRMLFLTETKRTNYKDQMRRDAFAKNYMEKRLANQPLSGGGSTIEYTINTRQIIKEIIDRYEIKSMIDTPCGDFSWMPYLLKELPNDFRYMGGDIVPDLIENNRLNHPKYGFKIIDITKDDLPAVDLIFCRDAHQHLPINDIQKSLENFSNSGSKYVLMTTYLRQIGWRNRRDIRAARCNNRNLLLTPFNLIDPIVLYAEQDIQHKYLGLWKLPISYINKQ